MNVKRRHARQARIKEEHSGLISELSYRFGTDLSNVVTFGHNKLRCPSPHCGPGDSHICSYIDYITAYVEYCHKKGSHSGEIVCCKQHSATPIINTGSGHKSFLSLLAVV